MKIYNSDKLENTLLIDEARQFKKAGFINSDQYEAIKVNLDSLRTQNNVLLRILLFLLGALLFLSLCGVCALSLIHNTYESFMHFVVFIFSLIGFIGAEIIIKNLKYYRHGLEEAFILGGQIAFIAFIYLSFGESEIFMHAAAIFIFVLSFIRYINLLSAIGIFFAIIAFIRTIFLTYALSTGFINKQSIALNLQIVLVFLAALIYILTIKIFKRLKHPVYVQSGDLLRNMSLILLGISGNIYFLLNSSFWGEGYYSGEYYYSESAEYKTYVMVLFWSITYIVPIIYIYFSLKHHNRVMLWVGLFGFGLSIFIFIAYYHFILTEIALIFEGILLFAVTIYFIRLLKNNDNGVTFKKDRLDDKNTFLNAEAIMAVSQMGIKPSNISEDSKPFSGGEGFNGGGSGGSF